MIIVVDGPEKVGKSTFIAKLVEQAETTGLHVIQGHMKRPYPADQNVYKPLVQLGIRSDTFVILDRSWISEIVYNILLERENNFAWTEGHRRFGQYVDIFGMQIILVEEVEILEQRRDATDHPIEPKIEREQFLTYGHTFHCQLIQSDFAQSDVCIKEIMGYIAEIQQDISRGAQYCIDATRHFQANF